MERLTTNKSVADMSMIELAHNSCYADAYPTLEEDTIMANIYALNRIIMTSRRNDGLYDDEEEDSDDYED